MRIECPICKAPLQCLRVEDGKMTKEISSEGEVTEISNESNGYNYVYCSKDKHHVLPSELVSKILNLVN